MATYEEQQKALRAQVPQGSSAAQELARQGFTDVGSGISSVSDPNTPVDTSQPKPSPDLFKVPTQGVGPGGEPIFDVFSGGEHIQDPSDPRLAGVNIPDLPSGVAPTGFKSKFERGFESAKADGTKADASTARSIIQRYSPSSTGDTASQFVQADPFIGNLVTAWQDFIKPENQRTSLSDTYKQMVQNSGIEAIDTELINTKNIIEGSEDDIRNEITKAGGFATESQILALTNARNKQLIKNYNTLLDTRNAKEKYLNTMIGLEAQDRQAADARFESMFNMGVQLADYQQRMKQNAEDRMRWLSQNIGFDGLEDSAGGDPYYTSLIEQSLGLAPGGLSSLANQARVDREFAAYEQELSLAQKEATLGKTIAETPTAEDLALDRAQKAAALNLTRAQTANVWDQINTRNEKNQQTDIEDQRIEALDTIGALNDLQRAKGLQSAIGPGGRFAGFFSRGGLDLTGNKQAFIGDVQKLVSTMTLDSLIAAKSRGATFGALSEGEMRVLASAATKIGQWAIEKNGQVVGYNVNEKAFREELDNIEALTKRAYILSGFDPSDVDVVVGDDGKLFTPNYDGTEMIEVYSP